jgi:hypothetical protein
MSRLGGRLTVFQLPKLVRVPKELQRSDWGAEELSVVR